MFGIKIFQKVAGLAVVSWLRVSSHWHLGLLAAVIASMPFLLRGPQLPKEYERMYDDDFRAAKELYAERDYEGAAWRFDRHIRFYPKSPHCTEAFYMTALAQVRFLRERGGADEIEFDLPLRYLAKAKKAGVEGERVDTALLDVAYSLFETQRYEQALAMFRELLVRRKKRTVLKLDIARCLAHLIPPKGEEALTEISEFIEIMKEAGSQERILCGMETRVEVLQELGRFEEAAKDLEELAQSGLGMGEWVVSALEAAGIAYLKKWKSLPPDADRDALLIKANRNFSDMIQAAEPLGFFARKKWQERAQFHIADVALVGRTGGDPVSTFTNLAGFDVVDPYLRFASAVRLGELLISRDRETEGVGWFQKAFDLANRQVVSDTSLVDAADVVKYLRHIAESSSSPESLEAMVHAAMAAGRFFRNDLSLLKAAGNASERLVVHFQAAAARTEAEGDSAKARELGKRANDYLVVAAGAYQQMLSAKLTGAEKNELLYKIGNNFFKSGFPSCAVGPLMECGIDRGGVDNLFAAQALLLLDKSFAAQGEYGRARQAFERCMQTAERTDYSRESRFERARTYEIEGSFKDAMQAYEEIFEFGPQDGMSPEHAVWQNTLLALGKLHLELGEQAGRKSGEDAKSAAPTEPTTWERHLERATELLEEALERSEGSGPGRRFDAAYLLAMTYMARGDWEKARRALALAGTLADRIESQKLGPDAKPAFAAASRQVFLLIADCLFMLDDFVRALDAYDEAERRATDGSERVLAIIGRARCYVELKWRREALQTLERAKFCVERMDEPKFAPPEFGKQYFRKLIQELEKRALKLD